MVCPPKRGVKGMGLAKTALLMAAAIMFPSSVCAQVADDGARAPAAAAPALPEVQAAGQSITTESWFIIIQFTDRNDAYLRGRPPVAAPQPGASNLGDTIRGISQQFGIEYMGARCDPVTRTCMLRYMRNGEVVNFYVDARTNKVIGREGF